MRRALVVTHQSALSVNGMSAEEAQRTLRRAFSQEEELCSAVRRIYLCKRAKLWSLKFSLEETVSRGLVSPFEPQNWYTHSPQRSSLISYLQDLFHLLIMCFFSRYLCLTEQCKNKEKFYLTIASFHDHVILRDLPAQHVIDIYVWLNSVRIRRNLKH